MACRHPYNISSKTFLYFFDCFLHSYISGYCTGLFIICVGSIVLFFSLSFCPVFVFYYYLSMQACVHSLFFIYVPSNAVVEIFTVDYLEKKFPFSLDWLIPPCLCSSTYKRVLIIASNELSLYFFFYVHTCPLQFFVRLDYIRKCFTQKGGIFVLEEYSTPLNIL